MPNGTTRHPIFSDEDYFRLLPNGISTTNTYKPRSLYPYEIRALEVILRNPILENALRNDFGKRTLNITEINALKTILRTQTDRSTPVIEKIFEETIDPFIKKTTEEVVDIQPVIEIVKEPTVKQTALTFQELQEKRFDATYAYIASQVTKYTTKIH